MNKTIFNHAYRSMVATLKSRRIANNLTQAKAAQVVGMSRQWLAKIEQCEVRLDPVSLVRLCRVYGVHADRLIRKLEQGIDEGADEPPFLSISTAACFSVGMLLGCWADREWYLTVPT